jgi:hypothetical protein
MSRQTQRIETMAKEDEIKLIAYSIWQQEGCLDGYDCDHWFKAEEIWEDQQKKRGNLTKKTDSRQAAQKPNKGASTRKKS